MLYLCDFLLAVPNIVHSFILDFYFKGFFDSDALYLSSNL